jgi:hypothetical protein
MFGPPQQGVASQYQTSDGLVVAVHTAHDAKDVPEVTTVLVMLLRASGCAQAGISIHPPKRYQNNQ